MGAKYLDLNGLTRYDGKIKEQLGTKLYFHNVRLKATNKYLHVVSNYKSAYSRTYGPFHNGYPLLTELYDLSTGLHYTVVRVANAASATTDFNVYYIDSVDANGTPHLTLIELPTSGSIDTVTPL